MFSVSYLSAEVFSFLQNFENSTHLAYALSFLSRISPKEKYIDFTTISSVQFSHSVASDCLRPHELQHTRPPSITNSQSSLKLTSMIGGQIYYIHNRNEIITKIKLNIIWFAKKKLFLSS